MRDFAVEDQSNLSFLRRVYTAEFVFPSFNHGSLII